MGFLFRPDPNFGAVICSGRGVQKFVRERAEAIANRARDIFLEQVKHTHPITPPPYADSFFVREKVGTTRWMVGNSDPVAVLVEFGAHPGGGGTFILAYHPLSRAIEEVY